MIGCTVTTAVTKTSSAYTVFRGCDLSSATLSITGAGSTVIAGGNYFTLAVNNASAAVLAKAVITMGPVTLTAGTLQLSDTLIYAATNTSNAVTQSAYSVLTLNNCQTLLPTLDNVARNSFGGYYSILHSVYDKANSTFGGVSLNAISYSQYINADRLTLSSGGQITFPDSTVQTTAYVAPTTGTSAIDSINPLTISRNGMTIRVTSAGMIQMSFNSVIGITGRSSINNADSAVISSPNGATVISTWYNIGAVLAVGDHLTATIVDASFHRIYRLTAIIREKDTTSGSEFATAYAIIEQLQ
jgi:hypothetical protein